MNSVAMFTNVLGGLCIFLLGMKHMSEGMQAVAGNRLRKMIAMVTDNRLKACATGAAFPPVSSVAEHFHTHPVLHATKTAFAFRPSPPYNTPMDFRD